MSYFKFALPLLVALFLSGCFLSKLKGQQVSHLVQFCHAEMNEGTGYWNFRTVMYRDDTARWHDKKHVLDYYGECGWIYE